MATGVNIKHLGIQTVFTQHLWKNGSLSEFQRGTLIGCHLCKKSSHGISSLQIISQSTVSCVLKTPKSFGTTAPQPQSVRLAQKHRADSFVELALMAEQLHPNHTSPSAMQSIGRSYVKHWTLEQWRQSDRQPDGQVWVWRLPQEQYLTALCQVWCRGDHGVGLFSRAGLGLLVPITGSLAASAYKDIVDNSMYS